MATKKKSPKLSSRGKKSAAELTWDRLSDAQRNAAARKIGAAALALAGYPSSHCSDRAPWGTGHCGDRAPWGTGHRAGSVASFAKGFDVVKFPMNHQRRPAYLETRGEDKQLTQYERHEIINLQRDMMRNSATRVAQDQQIRVNIVGSTGGKLYAAFPEGFSAAADQVMNYFNHQWFPRAEFTFRKNFNWLLKTILTAEDTNGNVILVFDDGILTGGNGTGRIRGFEGDEIAPVTDADFAKHFPKGYQQSAGFVYNPSGMFCGAFVSSKCRGRGFFSPGEYITLRQDPFDDTSLVNWVALGDMRRFNQGRAVSPLTAAITCLVDLHEITASEAQAAKINAQLVGQILTDAAADSGEIPTFDDDDSVTALPESQEFSTKELSAIGAHFDQMPEGLKIDLLDTKRPNPNMPNYIDFLSGLVGGTRGLARVYATLKAQTSYTAFRGEQVMTEPSFEEARQDLEREVCDWAARCVISRAVKLGYITAELPEHWQHMLAWTWPKMREVSEKDAQAALSQKLKNGVTSLARELGPGEVERIVAEQKREKALFDEAGLIYPSEVTVSGQTKDQIEAETDTPTDDNPTDNNPTDDNPTPIAHP